MKLRNTSHGNVIQAGVDFEVPEKLSVADSVATLYTTDENAIQTNFKSGTEFIVSNVDPVANANNVFNTTNFVVEGGNVDVYLLSTSGTIDIQVAINKGE